MNSSAISKLIVPLVAICGAMYLAVDILSSGGNALGKVYFYLLIGSAALGLLAPKAGFFYLVFLTAYLDYFKRLMILDSGMSYRDLYYVLGMAPATVCGIMASVGYSALQGRAQLARGQGKITTILLLGVTAATITTVMAASSEKGRAVGDAVNTFIYALLLLVVPVLFPTPQDLVRMLRNILYVFIPGGIYLLYHGVAGITSWEMAYVKSGFTVEIRQINELIFRPFGTMSSAAAASSIFSILAVMALYGPWGKADREGRGAGPDGWLLRTLGMLLFTAAAIVTYTRTGWVSGIIALGAAIMFRSKALTIGFYTVTVGLTLTLILTARSILQNKTLFVLTDVLTGGDQTGARNMALRVTTFTDRLQSFQNLLENSKLWTPFGWKVAGRPQTGQQGIVHDAISDALLNYGYVPLAFVLIIVVWFLRQMHRSIAESASPVELQLNILCAGCLIGTLAGCFSVWSQIRLFPVNFYLWLFPSVIFSIAMYRRRVPVSGVDGESEDLPTDLRVPLFRPRRGWAPPQAATSAPR